MWHARECWLHEAGSSSWSGGRGSKSKKWSWEEHRQENLLWFWWKGTGDAGEADSGLSLLNNFSGLWGIGTISSFLVLGPGMSGQVGGGPEG